MNEGKKGGRLLLGSGDEEKAAVITCILVMCRYMIQATRKQMQKTSRTRTAVPLSGKSKRGERHTAELVPKKTKRPGRRERDEQNLLDILWYDEKIDEAKQGS